MYQDFKDNFTLVEHLKKGNEKAYSFLVDTYNHALCIYVNSLMNNPSLAEDIVQNVFLNTWKNRKNLKSNYSIKSFLYKAVYNEFVDQYRRNQSITLLEKKYIKTLDSFLDSDSNEDTKQLMDSVMKSVQELPKKCRQVFILSKKEGLTNIEIAEYLNISVKAVEAQITKAFSLIRSKLNNKIQAILLLVFKKTRIN